MFQTLVRINEKVYLEFGNAVLFGMAFCVLLVFTDLLFLKIRVLVEREGWRGIWRLARDYIRESRPFDQELTVSVYIVFMALCLRAFFIWQWRADGSLSGQFPIHRVFFADFLMVVGFACVIRISARTDPRNWPWMASILFSLALGFYTVNT